MVGKKKAKKVEICFGKQKFNLIFAPVMSRQRSSVG